MNPEGGYTRQYRRMWDNPVFRSYQEAAVFSWMKDVAQWRETTIRTKFGPVDLGVGEMLMAEREIADRFGLHRNTVRNLIQRMSDAGMITRFLDRCPHRAGTIVRIVNYVEYQYADTSEGANEDRKRTESGTEEGPKKDRSGTKNNEVNTGKEGEVEREVGAPVADAPEPLPQPTSPDLFADGAPPPSKVVKLPKGTRLSADWVLPIEWGEWAVERGAHPDVIRREAEKFRDYWHAKAGAASRKADWYATWRMWMRRTLENPRNGDRSHGAYRQTGNSGSQPAHSNAWAAAAYEHVEGRH